MKKNKLDPCDWTKSLRCWAIAVAFDYIKKNIQILKKIASQTLKTPVCQAINILLGIGTSRFAENITRFHAPKLKERPTPKKRRKRIVLEALVRCFQWHSGQRKNFVHLQAIFYSKMPSSSRILCIKLCTTKVWTLAVTLAILRSQPELFARQSTCKWRCVPWEVLSGKSSMVRRHLKIGSILSKDLAYTSLA